MNSLEYYLSRLPSSEGCVCGISPWMTDLHSQLRESSRLVCGPPTRVRWEWRRLLSVKIAEQWGLCLCPTVGDSLVCGDPTRVRREWRGISGVISQECQAQGAMFVVFHGA